MLRQIIAAVLASACLAFPQRGDGAPANVDPNHQPFGGVIPNMQPMQGMTGMPSPQFRPFNTKFAVGLKR
nr:conotoxin precursor B2 [Conus ebraeus]